MIPFPAAIVAQMPMEAAAGKSNLCKSLFVPWPVLSCSRGRVSSFDTGIDAMAVASAACSRVWSGSGLGWLVFGLIVCCVSSGG